MGGQGGPYSRCRSALGKGLQNTRVWKAKKNERDTGKTLPVCVSDVLARLEVLLPDVLGCGRQTA